MKKEIRKYSRSVSERASHGTSGGHFLVGREGLPARPSDQSILKAKRLCWLDGIA
jgi:hypothetical protein